MPDFNEKIPPQAVEAEQAAVVLDTLVHYAWVPRWRASPAWDAPSIPRGGRGGVRDGDGC